MRKRGVPAEPVQLSVQRRDEQRRSGDRAQRRTQPGNESAVEAMHADSNSAAAQVVPPLPARGERDAAVGGVAVHHHVPGARLRRRPRSGAASRTGTARWWGCGGRRAPSTCTARGRSPSSVTVSAPRKRTRMVRRTGGLRFICPLRGDFMAPLSWHARRLNDDREGASHRVSTPTNGWWHSPREAVGIAAARNRRHETQAEASRRQVRRRTLLYPRERSPVACSSSMADSTRALRFGSTARPCAEGAKGPQRCDTIHRHISRTIGLLAQQPWD